MSDMVQNISFVNLAIAFVPAFVVVGIFFKWSLDSRFSLYALGRMLLQLLLVGYVLATIFDSDSATIVLAVLVVMLFSSSWIALGSVKTRRRSLVVYALFSIATGGGVTLFVVTQGVLELQPWYLPRYMIPLAGMVFANSMNSLSLAAERMGAEIGRGASYDEAKKIAFRASLIPVLNSLFAVGLVSIPGMMTGQILSGTSPLIATRYQIMVMCMIFSSAGISSAMFLTLSKNVFSHRES